jgi:predicted anti-sigma-YlaC factor YlaD
MNCAQCEERLSDYLESSLDVAEYAGIDAHLQSCSACSELLEGVREVMQWGRHFQVEPPSPWLSTRILANTPHVVRVTWGDWMRTAWKDFCQPRFAMTLLTSTLVLGWMGNLAGISASDVASVRHPSAVYNRVEGWANRAYGDAIRAYYSSPIISTIQCLIHTRIEQFRESS